MIKYPNNITKSNFRANKTLHANRGMGLEKRLENTHNEYLKHNIALVYKKEIPIKILRTEKNLITKAFFLKRSTTDYSGIYKGIPIDFEAKSTNLDSFNILANVHKHQLEHLKSVKKHGGIAFILLEFVKHQKIFFITIEQITSLLDTQQKSISFTLCCKLFNEVKQCTQIDYIKIIDKITSLGET